MKSLPKIIIIITFITSVFYSLAHAQTNSLQVVRIYFTDRQQLPQVEKLGIDLFESVTDDYALGQVTPTQKQDLINQGYRVEDVIEPHLYDVRFDPTCYRTFSQMRDDLESLSSNYPNIVELVDIGDTWEKQQNLTGESERDLIVLKITNKRTQRSKPKVFIEANQHAREIATAELAYKIAQYLAEEYDQDARATWLVDNYETYIIPMANPDGHVHAVNGESWRKNTNNQNRACSGGIAPNSFGIDTNRNYDIAWGGASSNPCAADYQGPGTFSEPETQAIRDYINTINPNFYFDIHGFSELIMYPWGYTTTAPRNAEDLEAIAKKMASYNSYRYGQISRILYTATGSSGDWVYNKLGIPSIIFEIGKSFTPSCSQLADIIQKNFEAIIYGINISSAPYTLVKGPEVINVEATKLPGEVFKLTAQISDEHNGNQAVVEARYLIDEPGPPGSGSNMTASDGSLDTPIENAEASIDTSTLSEGRHTILVIGSDSAGNWGPYSYEFITVSRGEPPPPPPEDTEPPTVAITSPSNNAVVEGEVIVNIQAEDNVNVKSVKLFIDETLRGEFSTPPYERIWDTTTYQDGEHYLSAKSYDAAGNEGVSQQVTVSVHNQSGIVLKSGFNKIEWINLYPNNLTAAAVVNSVNEDCGENSTKIVTRRQNDIFEDYIPEYGGRNFPLETGNYYWIRVLLPGEDASCTWTP